MPRKKSLKLAKEAASSEDEWEDVAEDETETTDVNIKSDVEIELDVPNVITKHQKKQNQMREWLETMIKRAFNKGKKEIHIKMHQTHLLCLLCMGFQLNDICNHPEVQAKALSILPLQYAELSSTKVTLNIIQKLMQWINEHFKDKIIMQKKRILNLNTRLNVLKEVSEKGKLELKIDLVLFHLAIYRVLGIQARLVISLQPISYKPPSKKMLMEKAKHVIAVREKKKIDTQHELDTVSIPQLDGANDIPPVRRSLRNRTSKSKPVPNNNSTEDDKDLTSVKSKYNFKRQTAKCDKTQLPLNSNQNGFNHMGLSPSKKISQMAKANNSNGDSVDQIISPANCGKNTTKESKNKNNSDDLVLSPAKKISRMAKMSHNSLTSEEDEFIKKTSNKSVKKIQKVARKNAADTKEQCLEVDFTSIDKKPSSGKLKQSVKQLQEKVEKGSTRPPVSKTFSKYHNDKHQDSFANDKENVSCRALPAVTLVKTEALDCVQPRKLRTSRKRQIKSKESSPEHGNSGVSSAPPSSSEDDDFVEPKATSKRRAPLKTSSSSNKSTSKRVKREASLPKPKSPVRSRKPTHPLQDEWIEVYIPQTGWVNLDCVNDLLNDPKSAEANATQPLHYVIAYDGDACVKDVTARYASGWLTSTRKLRISYVEADWWKETLAPYQTEREAMDREENKQLESDLLAQPIPTSIAACKDHPLFALRRHLLKYEGIYPPDVPAIGFVRGEEILPRSAVHLLHTREKWLQSAMSVRDGEEPYKMVASFLLNKKLNRDSDTPSLPLFGKWQTEAYKPAVAKDGKVPRNDYGNVDLFQPSMLPIGCVHLRLAGLNTVARKLNIDVSTAIIGFDTHSGYPHPVTDGYVACQEHEAILREAWAEDQQHAAERARNKRDQRIYGNWKKLIRGLRALERVRRKYDNKKDENVSLEGAPTTSDTAWQAERLEEAKKQEKSKSRRRGRNSKKKKNELLPFESETL